jgi:hypothetical protein
MTNMFYMQMYMIILDFCVYIYLLDLSSTYERKHVAFGPLMAYTTCLPDPCLTYLFLLSFWVSILQLYCPPWMFWAHALLEVLALAVLSAWNILLLGTYIGYSPISPKLYLNITFLVKSDGCTLFKITAQPFLPQYS